MPYKAQFIERIFFIRWDAPPSSTETDEVVEKLTEGAARLGPGPLAFVCSVAPLTKLPDARQRQHIHQMVETVRGRDFGSVHLIFEGNELQLIAHRLNMQAVMVLANVAEPSIVQIHGRAEPAAQHLSGLFGPAVFELFRGARERALVA